MIELDDHDGGRNIYDNGGEISDDDDEDNF